MLFVIWLISDGFVSQCNRALNVPYVHVHSFFNIRLNEPSRDQEILQILNHKKKNSFESKQTNVSVI